MDDEDDDVGVDERGVTSNELDLSRTGRFDSISTRKNTCFDQRREMWAIRAIGYKNPQASAQLGLPQFSRSISED